jgi:hypothetical protein
MKRDKVSGWVWCLPLLLWGAVGASTASAAVVEFDETTATLGPDSTVNFDNQVLSSEYCDDGECERSYIVTMDLDGQKSIIEMVLTLLNDESPEVRVEYELANGSEFELYDASASEKLTVSYVRTQDHTLDIRIEGDKGTNYNLKVSTLSTVPLPATAWLFLSAIGGATWLRGRRRRPSVKSV